MKVFIENEAGKAIKNLYDEKNQIFKQSVNVVAVYPFPYGFIPNTTSGDGDNLDCFILTKEKLKTGQIVEAESVAMMEVYDSGQLDHNIIARLPNSSIDLDEETKARLVDFINNVFSDLPHKKMVIGDFLPKAAADKLVEQLKDSK